MSQLLVIEVINSATICAAVLKSSSWSQVKSQRSRTDGDDVVLSELTIPQPVEQPEDESRETFETGEQTAHRHSAAHPSLGEDVELTELAIPAPIPSQRRADEQNISLESTDDSRFSDSSTSQVSSTRAEEEKPPRQSKTGITYTELCAISWMIFFSILGTLARLGVQAISVFPDSVFPSPVRWANFGGSLLLGLLLEDRSLFRYAVKVGSDPETFHNEVDKGLSDRDYGHHDLDCRLYPKNNSLRKAEGNFFSFSFPHRT